MTKEQHQIDIYNIEKTSLEELKGIREDLRKQFPKIKRQICLSTTNSEKRDLLETEQNLRKKLLEINYQISLRTLTNRRCSS